MKPTSVYAFLGTIVLVLAACGPATRATPAASNATPSATSASAASTVAPSPTSQAVAPSITPTARQRYGGTLKAQTRIEPSTWDPAKYHGVDEHKHLNLIYDRLFTFREGPPQCQLYPIQPDIAKAWRWADDTTLDVQLLQGVHFQEGSPVNGRELVADDVVYSFKRMFEKLGFFQTVAAATENITAVDRYTVRFKLKSAFADFVNYGPAAQQAEVLAAGVVGADGTWNYKDHLNTANGPFVLAGYVPGTKIETVRNQKYFRDGLPYLDGIDIYIMPDESTVLAALRSRRLDVAQLFSTRLGLDAKKHANLATQSCGYSASAVGFIGTDDPPFTDVRVRRAMSMAIDRETFAQTVWSGLSTPRWSPVHVDFGDWALPLDKYPPEVKKYITFDPKGAKQLLVEAGLPNGFETQVSFNAVTKEHQVASEALASMLGTIGITVKLVPMDPGRWREAVINQNKYQGIALKFASSTTLDEAVYSYFHTGAPRNASRVSDPRLDELLDAQRRLLGETERRKALNDLQIYLADKQYRIELPESAVTLVMQPEVRNVVFKTTGWVESEFYRFAWLDK